MRKMIFSIALFAVMLSSTGCSFLLKDRPPEKAQWEYSPITTPCSTNNGWAYFDIGYSILNLAAGLSSGYAPAAVYGVNGLIALSGIDGFGKSSGCAEFKNYKIKQLKEEKKIAKDKEEKRELLFLKVLGEKNNTK